MPSFDIFRHFWIVTIDITVILKYMKKAINYKFFNAYIDCLNCLFRLSLYQ